MFDHLTVTVDFEGTPVVLTPRQERVAEEPGSVRTLRAGIGELDNQWSPGRMTSFEKCRTLRPVGLGIRLQIGARQLFYVDELAGS